MKNPHLVTQNYRERWSELPKGEFDLKEDDIVDLISKPSLGSSLVRKEDGTNVWVSGFSGYILQKIEIKNNE